jgi:hypothetical protein
MPVPAAHPNGSGRPPASVHFAQADVVSYPGQQDRADELVPIGWCNACVAEAAAALAAGHATPEIHAGVTLVPVAQQVNIPGIGPQWVVIAAPACTARHVTASRQSPLLPGSGALPGF